MNCMRKAELKVHVFDLCGHSGAGECLMRLALRSSEYLNLLSRTPSLLVSVVPPILSLD